MKKNMRIAFFIMLMVFCVACGKEEENPLLQGEHVPGTSEANLPTPTTVTVPTKELTPVMTPTEATNPTVIPAPTTAAIMPLPGQTEVEGIAPLITTLEEEPAFMEMYRVMPAGTKIDAEGIPEEELGYCFCALTLGSRLQTALAAEQKGQDVQSLCRVRVLYYRSDGNLYIADVIADKAEAQDVKNSYYSLFVAKDTIDTWTEDSLPESLVARGYKAAEVQVDGTSYLLIYK